MFVRFYVKLFLEKRKTVRGKLNPQQLRENVLSILSKKRNEVLVSAGISEDCAAIKCDDCLLITSDPITSAEKNAGSLAINVCVNDLASSGADAFAVMLTIIMPIKCNERDVRTIMLDAESMAKKLNVDIIGGHTEFSDAVNRIIVCATAIGRAEKIISSSAAELGDSIIVTKHLAIEGTVVLAQDFHDKLDLTREENKLIQNLTEKISVQKEGTLCSKLNIRSMHDITEGGVFGAIAEVTAANKKGAEIYAEKIPYLAVTEKICSKLKLNKHKLLSSGSMLIITSEPETVIGALKKEGIDATIIGMITDDNNAVCVYSDGKKEVISVECDEINKVFGGKNA